MRHLILLFAGLTIISYRGVLFAAQVDTTSLTGAPPSHIPQQHWRFGVQNGISFQWTDVSAEQEKLINDGANTSDVDDFYKQFRRAYHLTADVHHIFADTWGVGVKYSLMASTADQFMRFDVNDGINQVNTNIINKEYVNFVGASFFIQQQFRKAKALRMNSSLALGYARYRNELEVDFSSSYFKTNTLATGNTFGGSWDISLEYFPLPMVSVTFGTGIFLARFSHLSVMNGREKSTVDLTGDDRKNVSRFDFFIGFRIYLK